MEIRFATVEDSEILSKIHAKSWKVTYIGMIAQEYLDELQEDFWSATFRDWLSTEKAMGQILMDNEKAVGCAIYGKSRDSALPDYGEIISVYLLPEYWGTGLGKKLIENVWKDLKAKGFQNAYLWALRENARARRFYEKMGFKETEDILLLEIMGEQLTDLRYVCAL